MTEIRVVDNRLIYGGHGTDMTLLANIDPGRQCGQTTHNWNRSPNNIRFEPPLNHIYEETLKRPKNTNGEWNALNPNNETYTDYIRLANMACTWSNRERSPVERLFKSSYEEQLKEYIPKMASSLHRGEQYDQIAPQHDRFSHRVSVKNSDRISDIISPHVCGCEELINRLNESRRYAAFKAIFGMGNYQGHLDLERGHAAKTIIDVLDQNFHMDGIFMTHAVCDLEVYRRLVNNVYGRTHANLQYTALSAHEPMPMPGIPWLAAVVDINMPKNQIKLLNQESALSLREGSKWINVEREFDVDKWGIVDDYKFVATDTEPKTNRKFGMTLSVKEPSRQMPDVFDQTGPPTWSPPKNPGMQRVIGAISQIISKREPRSWIIDRIMDNGIWEWAEHGFQVNAPRISRCALLAYQ